MPQLFHELSVRLLAAIGIRARDAVALIDVTARLLLRGRLAIGWLLPVCRRLLSIGWRLLTIGRLPLTVGGRLSIGRRLAVARIGRLHDLSPDAGRLLVGLAGRLVGIRVELTGSPFARSRRAQLQVRRNGQILVGPDNPFVRHILAGAQKIAHACTAATCEQQAGRAGCDVCS